MKHTRLALLAVPLATSALLVHCVGDTPVNQPIDAGSDTSNPQDSGADVGKDATSDVAADGPLPCVIPDSGVPGSLDIGFSTAQITFTNAFEAVDITVDGTGQVYVAGAAQNCATGSSGGDYAVIRLKSDGNVDGVFNPGNKPRCASLDSVEKAYAVRVDPDGNIVLAGLSGNGTKFFAGVARLTPAGALDTTFNGTGKVDLLGQDAGASPNAGFIAAFDVAFDPTTKKIFVVGGDNNTGNVSSGYVARLNGGGALDIGFAGGVVSDPSVDAYWAAAEDGAGGVFVAGQTHSPRRIVVKHYDATGKLDTTFGTSGATALATPDASTGDHGRSLLRLDDGRLVVAGATNAGNSSYGSGRAAIARMSGKGAPDPTFGGGLLNPISRLAWDSFFMTHVLGTLCDGTVFMGGRLDTDAAQPQDLAVAKFAANGTLVGTFGDQGIASLPLAGNQSPVGAAQDPKSGKIVVIGGTQVSGAIVAARFNP